MGDPYPESNVAAKHVPSSNAHDREHGDYVHDHEHGHNHDNHHEHGHNHGHEHGHGHPTGWGELLRIGFVAVCCVLSWVDAGRSLMGIDLFALAGTLIGGLPIFKEAWNSIVSRRMTMELSMTIALTAALIIGEFFTAAVITLFVLIAEVLEGLTVGRGRRALKDLLDLLPHETTVVEESGERTVRVHDLQIGDTIMIRPGSLIPVDGEVTHGNSFVDQATITGESLPVEKVPGARVYAGTMNQHGALTVRTTGVGHNTAFGKIIEAVEQAERSRAPIQKVADRLAGYLVYFALACAVLTYLITYDVRSTISVIIVAGACGIAAGTPLAVLGAIGLAARTGAIVKGGRYLEVLGTIDTLVLDKTGTLTFGKPEVVAIHPCNGATHREVLVAAAIAEAPTEHPLGKAILRKAASEGVAVPHPQRFSYTPGKGIVSTCDGNQIVVGNRSHLTEQHTDVSVLGPQAHDSSEILVAQNGRCLGSLDVADVLRAEAVDAVAQIREMGIRTLLMTGDSKSAATAIADQLQVDSVEAEMLPEDKLARVKELAAQGATVAMVGDGINDAPALMESAVGVAMGSGTDVARESADVILLGDDLLRLVETLKIAIRCRRIIMANFAGTLVVDGVGVGLAAFGYLNPLMAAFIHVSSELIFILNSARLIPGKGKLGGPMQPKRAQASGKLASLETSH